MSGAASRSRMLLLTPAGRNVLVGYRRLLPRSLEGARALSTKTLEKHNVLMEGMPKRSSKGGGIANIGQSIEATIVAKQRNAEAAYFYNQESSHLKRPADSPSAAAEPPRSPEHEMRTSEVERSQREEWTRMIDQEFSEFEGEHIPKTLKSRIADIKGKILKLLEQTSIEADDDKSNRTLSKEAVENLREVNLRMIRNMKKLELGIKSRDEEAREVMLERLRKQHGGDQSWTVSDLVMSAALLLFAGTGYFTYKVSTDDAHARRGREVAPSFVTALEKVGLVTPKS